MGRIPRITLSTLLLISAATSLAADVGISADKNILYLGRAHGSRVLLDRPWAILGPLLAAPGPLLGMGRSWPLLGRS